jgi:hypothetical protein
LLISHDVSSHKCERLQSRFQHLFGACACAAHFPHTRSMLDACSEIVQNHRIGIPQCAYHLQRTENAAGPRARCSRCSARKFSPAAANPSSAAAFPTSRGMQSMQFNAPQRPSGQAGSLQVAAQFPHQLRLLLRKASVARMQRHMQYADVNIFCACSGASDGATYQDHVRHRAPAWLQVSVQPHSAVGSARRGDDPREKPPGNTTVMRTCDGSLHRDLDARSLLRWPATARDTHAHVP